MKKLKHMNSLKINYYKGNYSKLESLKILFLFLLICMCGCHVCGGTCAVQKSKSDTLEVEL